MQDININISYSITTNTFSTPEPNQSISQQLANTVRKLQEEANNSNKQSDEKMEAIINTLNEVVKDFQHSDAFQKLPATNEEALNHKNSNIPNSNDDENDTDDRIEPSEDDFDPMTWSPLQDVIDAMPTFDMSS